ncbi:hypothetical protein TSO221_03010 [Azospirillum sp. TSO22-1]|nr:hypothetical protein TSO221_03010 [Azospirillum sp. TSO22-1]
MNRRRPLILLVLAALLPLVVLSAALSTAWLLHEQDEMRDDAFEQVDRMAALLDRELAAQVEVLRAVAQSPMLDGDVDQAAFAKLAERIRQDRPLWRVLSLSDPDGNRLVDVPVVIGNGPGKVIEPDSHARVVQTRRPTIGHILRGPKNLAFAIRVPVLRGGRVPYVLSAVVMPDGVRGLLDYGLPPGWIAAVVDAEGFVVATSRGGNPDRIGRKASDGALAARAAAAKGLYDGPSTIEGHATKVAYRVLPDSFWSVHVGIPRDMYTAPFVRSVWLLAGGSVLSLLLVASFLWVLAREMHTRRAEETALEEGRRMEALGRMTGGVAHDFNNLLMIAQGGAESIRNRPHDTERVVRYADAILATVQRGEALTRQLLAFARRSPQEPVSFLLQDRADELLTLLSRSTRGDIAVTLAVPAEVWPIFADPDGLEVALVNLAVNARDAMPGGGRLDIGAENVTLTAGRSGGPGLGGDYVAVRVRDTGTGIRAEDLGHIFEPFYTTKAVGKGTGLGLSQVMGYARQSGGAVTADSRLGEGTTFTLYLPRAVQPPVRPVRRTAEAMADAAGRILLVEDNPDVARTTEDMLTAAGHRVSWVPSGPAALARIDAGEAFDAVLSDIVMEGGLSGLELAQRLRERRPALPIVLMTGYSEALAAGVPGGLPVLGKPFGQAEVLAALRSARAGAEPEAVGTL